MRISKKDRHIFLEHIKHFITERLAILEADVFAYKKKIFALCARGKEFKF